MNLYIKIKMVGILCVMQLLVSWLNLFKKVKQININKSLGSVKFWMSGKVLIVLVPCEIIIMEIMLKIFVHILLQQPFC